MKNSDSKAVKLIISILAIIIIILVILLANMNDKGTKSGSGEVVVSNQTVLSVKTDNPDATAVPSEIPTSEPTSEPTAEPTEVPLTYTEMTLLSTGDIMFHLPQINGAYNGNTDSYSFLNSFKYIKEIVSAADYSVANFETTLHDTNYSGFPSFCAPVSTLDAIKDTGFNCLLFANNHMYDRRKEGLINTMNHFEEYGFQYLGATKDSSNDPSWLLVEVNGIKIGMMNYTDSITGDSGSNHTINGGTIDKADWDYMNVFVRGQENDLYERVQRDISVLKDQGADILIMYIHWGNEYELTANNDQKKMAQKFCDMGIDIILGSHPHVIQPMEVLHSESTGKDSICFYSFGNLISNQNRLTLPSYDNRIYTENGLMVKMNIRKYSDDTVYVTEIDYTPTWVHRYMNNTGYYSHEIIPLPVSSDKQDYYGLTKSDFGVKHSTEAFEMTDKIFKDTVQAYNDNIQIVISNKK